MPDETGYHSKAEAVAVLIERSVKEKADISPRMAAIAVGHGYENGIALNGHRARGYIKAVFPCYETPDPNEKTSFRAETIDIYNLIRRQIGECLNCPASLHCRNRQLH